MNTQLIDAWLEKNQPNALAKLSVKSGLSMSTLSNIKNHKTSTSVDNARDLADALGVSLDVLVPGAGDTNPPDVA